jgi:hypothetical protein
MSLANLAKRLLSWMLIAATKPLIQTAKLNRFGRERATGSLICASTRSGSDGINQVRLIVGARINQYRLKPQWDLIRALPLSVLTSHSETRLQLACKSANMSA